MKPYMLITQLLKNNTQLITFFLIPILIILVIIGCNRQVNENVGNTNTEISNLQKTEPNEKPKGSLDKLSTTQKAKQPKKYEYAYDEFYGEKKFSPNYISEYGMKFRELTFLIDTNYLEACPGHYSQIAYYVTAPERPKITYKRISGKGKISVMKSNEKSGPQTLGSYRFRAKIEETGTHFIEIKASVGTQGEAGYIEKKHQITIEASCKNTCPPFTEKIIPTNAIPWVLPYDLYITSSENSSTSKNENCKTTIDIEFKDKENNAVNYQIFEGISPFIKTPISKQIYQNPSPVFNGTGNGQQSGICNGDYYIELSDPTNGCRTHKAFEVQQGELTSENLAIFKPDTLYKQKDGKKYMIVNNPHLLIKSVQFGPQKHYFKLKYRENLPHKFRMTKEKGIEITKQLINFDETFDSLYFNKEKDYCTVFHKGVKLSDLYFLTNNSYIQGLYFSGLNVNIEDIISKADALEIAKLKAKELGYEVADTNDMNLELEERKRRSPNENWGEIRIKTLFHIEEHNDEFVPCYNFKLHSKKFRRDPIFWVNANNGDILLIKNNGLNKCTSCQGGAVVKSDCGITHPITVNPDTLACEFDDTKVYKFTNFPDIFDKCSSIKSTFNKCLNFEDSLVILSDVNFRINTFDTTGFAYISLINTAFNELEAQQLTAYKNVEQTYEYYNSKILDKDKFNSELPYIFIVPGYSTLNNAFATVENCEIEFGDGSKDNCKPNVSTDVVAHEFTHLILGKYVWMSYDRYAILPGFASEDLLSVALHESISDIMAILYNFSKTDTLDWVLFNELCADSLSIRYLNDPTKTKPKQKILYGDELVVPRNFDPYKWAGIINYWFYLVTEPMHKEANKVVIGEGIGVLRAEQMMFKTFEKLREIPNRSDSLSAFIDFVEFRDAALSAADEIFNAPTPEEYNLCSPEYTKAYLAFQAVGLIDNNVPTPCALLNYDSNLTAECPPNGEGEGEYFCYRISDTKWQFTTGFPSNFNNPEHTYWIQMAVDNNENGFFELDEYIDDESMSLTDDILNHKVTLRDIPSAFTKIKLVVTDVTPLKDMDLTNDAELYSIEYSFTCNSGCNLLVGGGWNNNPPSPNSGAISIFSNQNFQVCAGKSICIDYAVSGPVYMYVDITGNNFTKTVNQAGANTNGQFCWLTTIDDVGINTFKIKATDKHPTQPLTKSKLIDINVDTYNEGCLCAGRYADNFISLSDNIRTGHYVALKNLDSDTNIYSSSNVLFKAGKTIILNSGFYVPSSTNFEALISTCQQPPEPE